MAQCLRPIHFANGTEAPCGQCINCKQRLRTQWAFRLEQEQKRSNSCLFITLTYDDEHLYHATRYYFENPNGYKVYIPQRLHPSKGLYLTDTGYLMICRRDRFSSVTQHYNIKYNTYCEVTNSKWFKDELKTELVPSVSVRDVQLFNKRLRKWLKLKYGDLVHYRYYIAAEYGSLRHRPHYHMLMMLNGDEQRCSEFARMVCNNAIKSCWKNGLVDISLATSNAAINYCSKYMQKKQEIPLGALNTFSLKSKGLGLNYLTDERIKWHTEKGIHQRNFVTFHYGEKISMPRYYRDKIRDLSMTDKIEMFHELRRKAEQREQEDFKDFQTQNALSRTDKSLKIKIGNNYSVDTNLDEMSAFYAQYDNYLNESYMENQTKINLFKKETDNQ